MSMTRRESVLVTTRAGVLFLACSWGFGALDRHYGFGVHWALQPVIIVAVWGVTQLIWPIGRREASQRIG